MYVENYIFINKASALVDQYEQIAYLDGKKIQTIRQVLSDYHLSSKGEPLSYTLPESYTTVVGEKKPESPLAVGEQAPLFNVKDIQGKQVNLKDLQGKKVLLNFSIINCGYCKVAIDLFNSEDYHLSDKITGIYINPTDEKSVVIEYSDKMSIPFPVIAGEKSMKEKYGVSVYPTFFLIDEKGEIEDIIYGYNKDFFERIKM